MHSHNERSECKRRTPAFYQTHDITFSLKRNVNLQVRVMVRGNETVLGDAASAHEIFLTDEQFECPLAAVLGKCTAQHLKVRSRWVASDSRRCCVVTCTT